MTPSSMMKRTERGDQQQKQQQQQQQPTLPEGVSRENIKAASKALVAFYRKQQSSNKKNNSSKNDDAAWLTIELMDPSPAKNRKTKAMRIQLPRPVVLSSEGIQACLIVRKNEKTIEDALSRTKIVFPREVAKFGLTPVSPASAVVTKVLSSDQLKKALKFGSLKKKGKLNNGGKELTTADAESNAILEALEDCDVILADDKVNMALPKLFGTSKIAKGRKQPIPVDVTLAPIGENEKNEKNEKAALAFGAELGKALVCTCALHKSNSSSLAVFVGSLDVHDVEELEANVLHVSSIVNKITPGGWSNIRSFGIKTANSIVLPIFKRS